MQRLVLRAKLPYGPVFLRVVEDSKVSPWNKPAFREICNAIQHASVYFFYAQAFFLVLAARIVDPTWKDMRGYSQLTKARVIFRF